MFVLYIIPLLVFVALLKKKKIDINIFLLLVSTLLCTWSAEVSTADGFIRDLGSSQLILEYERCTLPGATMILGLIGVVIFIYASISILRSKD